MTQQRFESAIASGARSIVGRLLPGSDLIHGLEEAGDYHGLEYAAIAFAYGSLSRASFKILSHPEDGQNAMLVPHIVPQRVEFLGGQGLICRDDHGERATHLHGAISDHNGTVRGGHFNAGENPVFNNLDFLLVELTGVILTRRFDDETGTMEMVIQATEPSSGVS